MSPLSFFFGGGFCFFLFWVLVCLVCLVLVSIVFFLFWFWFGGLSCVNCVCFFQWFGLLFSCLWWVYLFKFCLLVLVWLDFLGFSGGWQYIRINCFIAFLKTSRSPTECHPKVTAQTTRRWKFRVKKRSLGAKISADAGGNAQEKGEPNLKRLFWGQKNLDSACCCRGNSWGCLGMFFVRKNQSEWRFLWNNCDGMFSMLFSTEMFVGW